MINNLEHKSSMHVDHYAFSSAKSTKFVMVAINEVSYTALSTGFFVLHARFIYVQNYY